MSVTGALSPTGPRWPEARRAREPDSTGIVVRDGVRIAYEVFGGGEPTVVLMPTWSIVPSRFWKAQVPFLARHFRVVTFDGRGSGASDTPTGAAAYTNEHYAADAIAVLDATGTDRAVLVGLSRGAGWSVRVAAVCPERVTGVLAIGSPGFLVTYAGRGEIPWDRHLDTTEGWAKYNRHYWMDGGYEDFLAFFFSEMFPEPHSTKQIEDCVEWGRQLDPATLVDTNAGAMGLDGAAGEPTGLLLPRVRCPVTVIHGTDDRISPLSSAEHLAEVTGASMVVIEGGGHGLPARDPVRINGLIKAFVDTVHPPVARRAKWKRATRRPKRALYLSSAIGLGHARRDVAVADELRKLRPDLEIDWLAQHPVTRVLEDAGEKVHPASRWLASETSHIEEDAGEHDLHAFQTIRRMDETLVANFMVFQDVVTDEHYDLVVADEAWEVDYFLHENPELKRFAFAWMTDFVGWLPMEGGGDAEAALTADYNAEMIEQRERFSRVRDRSVFVGNPEDVIDETFGPGLPSIRSWAEDNFDFAGYVTGLTDVTTTDRAQLRAELGYGGDEQVCVVTVGGSGVGAALLHRVLDAAPAARRLVPGLRFVMVTGPRIAPSSLPRRRGVTKRGYLPDLYRHLAACDVALVQGGLTTCMELTAARRPFVYVPLRHHFEQNLHVRHRLERYGAGTCIPYEQACEPDALAVAIAHELTREVAYRPVESDGAARAASLLADLV